MLTKFSVVSYDGETMGYDTLVQNTNELTTAIFDYVNSFNESEEKIATIKVTEFNVEGVYEFNDDDEFFNSAEWNDESFDVKVILSTQTLKLKK